MKITIRKPNLNVFHPGTKIPEDFYQVMLYFNEGVKSQKGSYIHIPRKKLITPEEIMNLWMSKSSLHSNITFVAETEGKVVGQATVFYDAETRGYEGVAMRKPGEIGMSVHPQQDYKEIGWPLMSEIIEELRKSGKKATEHVDFNFVEGIRIMDELGYIGEVIENYPGYREAGLSGKVFEYKLP